MYNSRATQKTIRSMASRLSYRSIYLASTRTFHLRGTAPSKPRLSSHSAAVDDDKYDLKSYHQSPQRRWISSLSQAEEVQLARRHTGIQTHPDSISGTILPGNFVMKTAKSGNVQKRYTELVYGYFWMLKDLERSQEKPIIANTELIPEKTAKVFPPINGLKSLSGDHVVLPDDLLRNNRSKDATAQCTVVAVSFREFGNQMLPTWIDPVREALGDKDRVEILRLNISEGWLNKWILRGFIHGSTRKKTPESEHSNTLLYFGKELEDFRDSLRMYNVLTGYVFLLDGLGRVRFAGSGTATDEEVQNLVRCARDLGPKPRPMHRNYPSKKSGNKRRKS